MRAENKELEAMAMMATGPGGHEFLKFLERWRDDRLQECGRAEGKQMYRAQGAYQDLDEIIKLVKTAKDKLN